MSWHDAAKQLTLPKGKTMLPTRTVRQRIGTLLAADASSLAPATDANKIALVQNDFTPNQDLVAANLDLADFDGSTPIAGATGAQQTGLDPVTGQQIITIKDPAGGYRWITTGVTNLPQTIYGFALLSNDLSTLIAMEKLTEPVTLTASGQVINLGSANMTIVSQPVS